MLLRRWVFNVRLNDSLLMLSLKSGRLFQILGREKRVSFLLAQSGLGDIEFIEVAEVTSFISHVI